MKYDLQQIVQLAKSRYCLSRQGVHGVAHWQRVQENGLKLAEHNGANKDIVRAFSFLHDCCREDDGSDPQHGPRAAKFTETLRDTHIFADDAEFEKLIVAIHDHTLINHSSDTDIATCWDADRLDIGRVGIKPDRKYLSTEIAKQDRIIEWAYSRSLR